MIVLFLVTALLLNPSETGADFFIKAIQRIKIARIATRIVVRSNFIVYLPIIKYIFNKTSS